MAKEILSRLFLVLIVIRLMGCVANPEKRKAVAEEESVRMTSTSEPLVNFGRFELAPMALSSEVQARPEKVKVAEKSEQIFREQLLPMLEQWNSQAHNGSTLEIRPKMLRLRVPSSGSRFWIGAFGGKSHVDMQLSLVEKETGGSIVQTRVKRNASAMAGAWSIGRSDRNFLLYVADIVKRYLEDNYRRDT